MSASGAPASASAAPDGASAAPASGFRTRGQPAAVDAVRAMLAGGMPHALLLAGPPGVGKGTLADDIAAALLCLAPEPVDRPDRTCRACRAVEHGNHPDVHRLAPTGAGAIIPIGGPGREERGVRDLVRELALLPVEGGARIALIAAADRMTEDAQAAFLKTLEEPPAGTVLILTASDEERLLDTIRSRCVRIRLGPVPRREIEAILVDAGLVDAPVASRLARLSGGQPGEAVSLARAPASLVVRGEIGRTLLDLTAASRADRLRIGRDLLSRAAEMLAARRSGAGAAAGDAAPARGRRSGRANPAASGAAPADEAPVTGDAEPESTGPAVRVPAAERRAAALALISIWRDVVRDLALVGMGKPGSVRQLDLLDDLEAAARRLPSTFAANQLRRLDLAGERLEGNVSPELVLDALALGWVA
jgi:DNA polymerase III delta' subunit